MMPFLRLLARRDPVSEPAELRPVRDDADILAGHIQRVAERARRMLNPCRGAAGPSGMGPREGPISIALGCKVPLDGSAQHVRLSKSI